MADGDDAFLPFDMAVGSTSVWIVTARGYVAEVNPATGAVEDTIAIPGHSTGQIATDGDQVWVAEGLDGALRIDPVTRMTTASPIEAGSRRLAVSHVVSGAGFVWAAGSWAEPQSDGTSDPSDFVLTDERAVVRIAPESETTTIIALSDAGYLAFGDGYVWVLSQNGRRIDRIDPEPGRVDTSIALPFAGQSLTAAGGRLWLADDSQRLMVVNQP